MSYPKEYGGLGFQNLHLFNMAMVAKQGWNFIVKPHTLVSKVYMAGYFPNSSLFDAHLGAATMNQNEGWKWLWKIQAPPKAKHLLWGICRECLPPRTRLKESRRAWQAAGLEPSISMVLQQHNTARAALLHLCKSNDANTAGKIAMVVWVVWNNRNNWVWNLTKESGQQLGVKAMCLWSDWRAV
ncbi:RNA-directed DNA polymerase (Reverse transcriptase) [Trifolium medium]|uniref:RNA-directed DNA polymerase (Reverse transcriptase) n=1 Tax=Trifolium medium TaxID=97028 RepID=A0A392MUG6_9FABA|nr:RNA-directed DNA polymerase (Reverse transcriptase) [Trifolium medium]MCH90328.1 RNA-directed DNA polymerase (Reverse transcriptase) [Trifolium medium]